MTGYLNRRLWLYLPLIGLLTLALGLSLWTVGSSGAYLTDDGDWQGKAGQYSIGVIDYVVEADGSTILSGTGEGVVDTLAVPLKGGVRFFDPTLTDASLRTQEFNEGATILKLRVINRSDSLVEISATLDLSKEQTTTPLFGAEAVPPLRLLALPIALRQEDLKAYNYRNYVLDTLGIVDSGAAETAGLTAMEAEFVGRPPEQIAGTVIRGATRGTPVGDEFIQQGSTAYYYKDLFFLLWSEYGGGLHNETIAGETAILPTARLELSMTVGQLD